ncbi:MAG TPA: hypothetical protein VGF59_16895, partial [Bryobacteraceae bacterium]
MCRSSVSRVLLTLAFLVFADGAVVAEEEPSYGGKRLSEWVKELDILNYSTWEATQNALRRVDTKELGSLTSALRHKNADIRRNAAKVLGGIGPKAAPALKSLVPLLKD